jgi:hypothetical protein
MFMMIVVAVFLALNTFVTPEIAWALALAASVYLMTIRSLELALPKALIRILIFPVLLFFLGLPGVYNHLIYDVAKDMWYYSQPIVYIAFGYLTFERAKRWESIAQPFFLVGIGAALYSLGELFLNRTLLVASANATDYRTVSGAGYAVTVNAMILIYMLAHFDIRTEGRLMRMPVMRRLLYASAGIATLLALSRTFLFQIVSGIALVLNYRSIYRKLMANGGVGFVLLFAFLGGGVYYFSQYFSSAASGYVEKITGVGDEIKVQSYATEQEINLDWRGFESYRALVAYGQFNRAQRVAGGGFGSLVDLGFKMEGLSTSQEIPLLHNGYLFILIKTGVVGIFLFVLFVSQLAFLGLRYARSPDKQIRVSGYLIIWVTIVIVMSQGVITGIYNKGALAGCLFILGASVACIERSERGSPFRRGDD